MIPRAERSKSEFHATIKAKVAEFCSARRYTDPVQRTDLRPGWRETIAIVTCREDIRCEFLFPLRHEATFLSGFAVIR